jgi:hypothetical protein
MSEGIMQGLLVFVVTAVGLATIVLAIIGAVRDHYRQPAPKAPELPSNLFDPLPKR